MEYKYPVLSFRCNANSEYDDIPSLLTYTMLVMPAFYQYCIRGINWRAIMCCWLIGCIVVVISATVVGNHSHTKGWILGYGWIAACMVAITPLLKNQQMWISTFMTTLMLREVIQNKNDRIHKTKVEIKECSTVLLNAVNSLQRELTLSPNVDLMQLTVVEDMKVACVNTVDFMDNIYLEFDVELRSYVRCNLFVAAIKVCILFISLLA